MLIKETRFVPAHEEIERTYLCDLCDIDLRKQNEETFGQNEATIEYKEGEVYPEGDSRIIYTFDICMKCMKEKVFPLVGKTFGIESRKYSHDW